MTQESPPTHRTEVPYFAVGLGDDEERAAAEVLRSGWLTTGPQVHAFEQELAAYLGVPHVVAMNSCTAALHLGLEAVGIRHGDHVLVPSLTFAATAEAILCQGGIPVFVDTQDDGCLDLDHAEHLLERLEQGASVHGLTNHSKPAKAIMPVHYAGHMVDMEGVDKLAQRFNLAVVEDAAHAFPSSQTRNGQTKRAGSFGDVGCFSFYANKCITTGEGGAAAVHDAERAEHMRRMALHNISLKTLKSGKTPARWQHEVRGQGHKYNMTDYAAAIGRAQLKKADRFASARWELGKRYQERIGEQDGVTCLHPDSEAEHSWHLMVVRFEPQHDRDIVLERLKAKGIGSSVHWMPLHMHPHYRDAFGYVPEHCPKGAQLWTQIASLPIFPSMPPEHVDIVCDTLEEILKEPPVS